MAMLGKTELTGSARLDVASWLGFGAAPCFALMAWISAVGAGHVPMCMAAPALGPIRDMALMYLLMSFFHLPPWIGLVKRTLEGRRKGRV